MLLRMSVIALAARKGGVGKTSLTANLAAEFLSLGFTVQVLDADPQQSLLRWAQLGQGKLATITTSIPTEDPERFKTVVKTAQKTADLVLIDTPPSFADPALLAALLADVVLIPCGPSMLDVFPAKDMLELLREVRTERKGNRPRIFFVPNRLLVRTNLSADLPASLAEFGETVLPGIAQRTVIAESTMEGLTVMEYAPNSPARREFQALALAIKEVLS